MTAVAQDHLFFNFTQSCTLVFSVHIWCCTPKGNTSQISNCSHQFSKKAEGGRRKHLSHPCCLTQGNADLGIHALHCMESSTKGWCSYMCLSRYGVWQPGRQTTTQTQVHAPVCGPRKGFCTSLIQSSAFLLSDMPRPGETVRFCHWVHSTTQSTRDSATQLCHDGKETS